MIPKILSVRAPAKINLRLKIVGHRADGYHLLSMINLCCSLEDQISIESGPEGVFEVITSAAPDAPWVQLPADLDDPRKNLITRALDRFAQRTGRYNGARIRVLKSIPLGAGLGGGSSNAASVLRVAVTLAQAQGISVADSELLDLALGLGADVPYSYFCGGPALVRGIGERIVRMTVAGPAVWPAFLIFPPVHSATAKVFSLFRQNTPTLAGLAEREDAFLSDQGIVPGGELAWARLPEILDNDLISVAPEAVQAALRSVREIPGCLATMSGSGSALVVIPWPDSDYLSELEVRLARTISYPMVRVDLRLQSKR